MKKFATTLFLLTVLVAATSAVAATSILGSLPASPTMTVSTVPSNGDLNPYGVAFVPFGFPEFGGSKLHPGDLLVSNFNNSKNIQGTGSTIVRISPSGAQSVFYQGPASGIGLSTALGVLQRGYVLVGNVPTTDGTCATITQGSLIVVDRRGNQIANLDNAAIVGPWDLTVNDLGDRAQVFVSDVLNGTVVRLDLEVSAFFGVKLKHATQIGSLYSNPCNTAAVILGPTGLAYDAKKDVLYVASTNDNAIYAISNAGATNHDSGRGSPIYKDNAHLRGPLGLVLAPNGHLIAANGDAVNADPAHASELVEFTPDGAFVAQFQVDPAEDGAFGLAIRRTDTGIVLAAVDDNTNALDIWIVP